MNSQPSSRLVPCAVCGESFDPKAGGARLPVVGNAGERLMPICGSCGLSTSIAGLAEAIARFKAETAS